MLPGLLTSNNPRCNRFRLLDLDWRGSCTTFSRDSGTRRFRRGLRAGLGPSNRGPAPRLVRRSRPRGASGILFAAGSARLRPEGLHVSRRPAPSRRALVQNLDEPVEGNSVDAIAAKAARRLRRPSLQNVFSLATNSPLPRSTWSSPPSTTTLPRLRTVTGQPLIFRPSYGV